MTHPSTLARPARTEPGDRARPSRAARGLPIAAVIALGLFATARLTGVLVLAATAWATGRHPLTLLARSWDSVWYLGIAAHGYGRTLVFQPTIIHSDLAFFPLYPALVRVVTALSPLNASTAGLLVAWLAAAAAAGGIYAIGARLRGRAVATALVLLWGLLPHSVVLSMAYTEPVLTAFAAWSLYAVLSGHWLWAGTLAALAGLARPNGFAVAAAVLASAGYEIWRRRGRKVPHRLWTGAALAPLGWGGFVLWVGIRKGDPLGGYFDVQRLWGSRFDFGAGSLDVVKHLLLHGDRFVFPVTLVIVAAAVLLYALLIADRAPLPLVVYSGVLLLVTLGGSGFFESKPRFLLPAFPLLLPLAAALVRTARARPWHATLVVGALAGLSFAYGAYLVVLAHTPL
ncbi:MULTISPECIES: mannosyltransferase family protein [unclassified Streptomyces]|uniref:mannosyltransferase family protein n=1 Tax=unclassified Streptomyces TaxID=2593676 RepID=UPI002E801FD5|nr:mannosyltransferase family protein [Streptomyces sp. NBC_00589]WTI37621.1 mannosyltransferase family protein [Streptomyces sp. NBC_00775]WUB28701.1 mannosyltransferase family protein [Streptomyces sp. NBC_00589]